MAVAAGRPAVGEHRGPPAAQTCARRARRRARAWPCGAAPPPSPAATSRSSRRRRRTGTRAPGAAACRPRRACRRRAGRARRPWPSATSRQAGLGALEQACQLRTAGGEHRAELRLRRVHRRVPGVDGDDSPGRQHPAHVVQAGRGHAGRPAPPDPGSAARCSGGRCRRPDRPRTRPSVGTTRSNQSRKNHDSGGFCGVVISSTTTRPPGLRHACHLGQAAVEIGEVARPEADRDRVERGVRVGRARARCPPRSVSAGRLLARDLEHRLGEVEPRDLRAPRAPARPRGRPCPWPRRAHASRGPPAPDRRPARASGGACPAVMTEFMRS